MCETFRPWLFEKGLSIEIELLFRAEFNTFCGALRKNIYVKAVSVVACIIIASKSYCKLVNQPTNNESKLQATTIYRQSPTESSSQKGQERDRKMASTTRSEEGSDHTSTSSTNLTSNKFKIWIS